MSIIYRGRVRMTNLTPQLLAAIHVAGEIFGEIGCYVFSIDDGQHGAKTLHGRGRAVDLEVKHMDDDDIDNVLEHLRLRLPLNEFDIVDERNAPGGPHIHIEYDPHA